MDELTAAGTGRSLEKIDVSDLLLLGKMAAEAEAELFARHPEGSGRYAGRLLCRELCQGAALHYLDGKNGVKDFDVWSFYAQIDGWPFPPCWRATRDFGPSKFGRYPGDPLSYTGRRVDLIGRSLPAEPGAEPAAVLHSYLAAARTASARYLAAKAVRREHKRCSVLAQLTGLQRTDPPRVSVDHQLHVQTQRLFGVGIVTPGVWLITES